jgi:hypothetical protein
LWKDEWIKEKWKRDRKREKREIDENDSPSAISPLLCVQTEILRMFPQA